MRPEQKFDLDEAKKYLFKYRFRTHNEEYKIIENLVDIIDELTYVPPRPSRQERIG